MANCTVCNGARFVRAAPVSALPTGRYGRPMVSHRQGQHRKALWSHALTVPCWACGGCA